MEGEFHLAQSSMPFGERHVTGNNNVGYHQHSAPSNLESFFSQPDAIMAPNILEKMKSYIAENGQPQLIIKLLSENYRGLAQMVNLVSSWLALAGTPQQEIDSYIEDFLKDLVLKVFDPKKADTIFEKSQSAPEWLEHMVKEPQWRSMIYRLTEHHNNCLTLNFAIQRISDEGHQTEIAPLASASTFFPVYSRVIRDCLEKFVTIPESLLKEKIEELKKIVCLSQHTYLYVQFLLFHLSNVENGGNFKRLAQELELAVMNKGKIPRNLEYLFDTTILEYPEVMASVTSMITANGTNPSDVMKLYNAYSAPSPPPVHLIRRPILFELFIKNLFDPSKSVNPSYKSKFFWVLAYAATVNDYAEDKGEEKREHQLVIKALEIAQPICHKNPFASELEDSLVDLKENLGIPIIAMGILTWLRYNFTDPEYYLTSFNTSCIPIHLELLRDISTKFPFLRGQVFQLLKESFELETTLDALMALEMKKMLMDHIVWLLVCGHVVEVLECVRGWMEKMDQSLLRHFILETLECVGPPYSPEFIEKFLIIFFHVKDSLKHNEKKHLIVEFLEYCADDQRCAKTLREFK